jgi:peptide/nickel transport system ATP-binding protein
LRIESRIAGRRNTIVDGISFDLAEGETVGIVGESGSGKSMTVRALTGLLPQGVFASGSVVFEGKEVLNLPEREFARLRGSGLSLLFQDPFTMLNPLLTAGRHIGESLKAEGASRSTLRDEVLRRLKEVGIADPAVADRYPFQLSGGMRQRVGIAAALARDCRVLAADEPSTALDVTTQAEILKLLKGIQRRRGMGLVLITHDLRVAFSICDRVLVLYAGTLLEVSPPAALEMEPLHPYSLALLLSDPPIDRKLRCLPTIPGRIPAPDSVRSCCSFAPRCQWRESECISAKPPLAPVEPSRHSACIRLQQIRPSMRELRASLVNDAQEAACTLSPEMLVRARELQKSFDIRARKAVALAGMSLELAAGEVAGLVGESGSGKTTLGRCIAGLESPDSGSILVDGIEVARFQELDRATRTRFRRTVQMIFQNPYATLNPSFTIGATLREAIILGGTELHEVEKRLDQLLLRVGLPLSYASRKPVALSGGEHQRVAIARALAVRPKLLVCDEPVSAVDVSVQAQLLELFRSLRDEFGMTLLFITHDLAVARQVADRIHVMFQGRIVESGSAAQVLGSPRHDYTKRLIASIPRGPEWGDMH